MSKIEELERRVRRIESELGIETGSSGGGLQPDKPDAPAGDDKFPGQEAWVERIDTPWDTDGDGRHDSIDGSALEPYRNGDKIVPSLSTIRFMTGRLPQPSFVPNIDKGEKAPYGVTHIFTLNGHVVTIKSDETDAFNAKKNPIFRHVQFGPNWHRSQGWDITVRLAEFDEGPATLSYQTVTDFGFLSNPVTLSIAGRRKQAGE